MEKANLDGFGCELGARAKVSLCAALMTCLSFVASQDVVAADTDIDVITVVGSRLNLAFNARRSLEDYWSVRHSGGLFGPFPTVGDDSLLYQETMIPIAPSSGDSTPHCSTMKSNPIDYSTGNKIETDVDFRSSGYEMPLTLTRTYNHHSDYGYGLFGEGWTSNVDDRRILDRADYAYLVRPGGGAKLFLSDGGSIFYDSEAGYPQPGQQAVEYIKKNADGTYTYFGTDGSKEEYFSNGSIYELKNQHGIKWNFTYSTAGKLQRVTHSSGRYMQFNWVNGVLVSVQDPSGNTYSYTYQYLSNGMPQVLTAVSPGANPTTITYHYVNGGLLSGKSYNGVRYSYFEYDQATFLATRSYHAGGVEDSRFNYIYDQDGWITNTVETTPLGRQITHAFSSGKEVSTSVAQSSYCSAGTASKTFDARGALTSTTDFNGNVTKYTYSDYGQLLERIDAFGTPIARRTTYVWDFNSSKMLRETVDSVYQKDYAYDAKNRLTSIAVKNLSVNGVANQTLTTTYAYTDYPNGMTATMVADGPVAGSGDALTYSYSSLGDLVAVQNSLGHVVQYANYNGLGLPGRIVGENGETTDYTYDARGRVTKLRQYINGAAADTDYVYGGDGLMAGMTTPDGVTTTYAYDAARRLISEKRNASAVLAGGAAFEERRYAYNANSNVTSISDYADNVMKRVEFIDYDEAGRVRARRGNNGQNFRFAYDNNGNLKASTDSLGGVSTFAYDALNRVSSSTNPIGGVALTQYDAAGNVKKVTDPRGLATSYIYDGIGQLWAQSSPDTGTTTYQYNGSGQLTLMNRADGSGLSYVYDALGRLSWYGTSTEGRAFGYDTCTNGKGRVCTADYSSGTKHFLYTPEGRIAATLDWTSTAGGDYTAYVYDAMGRVTGISYPSGVSVGYAYQVGRPVAVTATIGGVTQNVVTNIRYMPNAGSTGWQYGNGLARNHYYDQNLVAGDLRLTGITTMDGGGTLQSQLLEYSANDQVVKTTNYANPNTTQTYSYDALSRLTRIVMPSKSESIQYDANGNRTLHNWLAPISNAVSATSNRIDYDYVNGGDGIVYAHDGRGNRMAQSWGGSTATYAYDGYNALKSTTRSAPSSYYNNAYAMATYPAGTTNYLVNAYDQRVAKNGSGVSARYVYAGQNKLLAENNNGIWTTHIWLGDQAVAMVRNGSLNFVHTDQIGRAEIITNAAKQVVWRANNFHSERAVVVDSIGGYNLGLPGQYYDSESGLWYNGYRYYDSRLGRYSQSDPIGLNGGVNTYSYAAADPVNNVDPSGLDWYYNQGTGEINHVDGQGVVTSIGFGYAGRGDGLNNSSKQFESNLGPVPAGSYRITAQDNYRTGKGTRLSASMRLVPLPGTKMGGRAGFLIHGDNARRNNSASHGCIVASLGLRNQIGTAVAQGDDILHVYADGDTPWELQDHSLNLLGD